MPRYHAAGFLALTLLTVTTLAQEKKMSPLYTLKMDSLAGKPVEFKQ